MKSRNIVRMKCKSDVHKPLFSAAILGLGAIFGGFSTAYIGSRFGRRKSVLILAVPDLLGWILIAAAQNLPMMLCGRFLNGFCAAGYSPSIQVNTRIIFLNYHPYSFDLLKV